MLISKMLKYWVVADIAFVIVSGLGKEYALAFAERGAKVVGRCRTSYTLQAYSEYEHYICVNNVQ